MLRNRKDTQTPRLCTSCCPSPCTERHAVPGEARHSWLPAGTVGPSLQPNPMPTGRLEWQRKQGHVR